MTLGGMLKHLTGVENWWLRRVLRGSDRSPSGSASALEADPDWEWTLRQGRHVGALVSRYREVVAEADAILDAALATPEGLDLLAKKPRDGEVRARVRWILVHLIEEYARHAGHADLIRESIDGATDL